MNDFNADMGNSGPGQNFDDDVPQANEADPYALHDFENMGADAESAAFINQDEGKKSVYDLNFLTQLDNMVENSAEIE